MQDLSQKGRPLPGWGASVRAWKKRTGHTALAIAAVASMAMAGCSNPTTVGPSSDPYAAITVTSQPEKMRAALAIALQHLDLFVHLASNPFHTVGISGQGLDATGSTVQATNSQWTFTFSRYAEPYPSQEYEVVTVVVPGTGKTSVTPSLSQDPNLSPIENWDNAIDAANPDSSDFVAHMKGLGVSNPAGATITLAKGVVTITAGGKTSTYDPVAGTYTDK